MGLFGLVVVTVASGVLLVVPGGVTGGAVATLAGSLVAGWMLLGMEGRSPVALGFHLGRDAPGEVGRGLLLGVGVGLAAVLAMAVAGGVAWAPEEGTLAAWVGTGARALGIFLVAAAAEEALLRGYPLQALAEAVGRNAALVATSVAFGLLHLGNPGAGWAGVVSVTAAGLFLGALVLRTGSLWWATGAHLGWNWAHGFLVDMPVSGVDLVDTPYLAAVPRGPELLSGGEFGPEGSLVAAVALAAAAGWAWWSRRLEPSPAVVEAGPLMELRRGGEADSTSNEEMM